MKDILTVTSGIQRVGLSEILIEPDTLACLIVVPTVSIYIKYNY